MVNRPTLCTAELARFVWEDSQPSPQTLEVIETLRQLIQEAKAANGTAPSPASSSKNSSEDSSDFVADLVADTISLKENQDAGYSSPEDDIRFLRAYRRIYERDLISEYVLISASPIYY
ncbi:hypothetical protein CCUS01_01246 [Colletotrichum cuscutae]|uniref:Uncharacterized protein n=1 Tax=Colletotrichum cuscutae TaxID=1209917 RepID=A0AAI9UZ56_9PEZI|nr:hypothetical protein CCUS01_01246 [Colletotrichum cuscutae]